MTNAEFTHSNRLITETSPYLLQHAHNPVDWYPWGEEALEEAKKQDKPILVSIGYSACHWCHVMERESFEDPEVAAIMNRDFINIKVDREERPDIDHIYMDAVQAMTGSGGWPLNVFLTPDARPFYGGTYFPPKRAFNRMSWPELLEQVAQAFRERRHEIDAQAGNLTSHLQQSNNFGWSGPEGKGLSENLPADAFSQIMKQADREWGGFGRAPKFPQTFTIRFLLRYHARTGDELALKQALLSLDRMIEGGIYDQLGGGFARYSTDTEWLAPHFEKMLYDNALLVSVLAEAYQLTQKQRYREVIGETIDFVTRELMHPGGGFYAALDADSEGEEGRFYVWQLREVQDVLGEEAELFCAYYDITGNGNWEGTNILRVKKDTGTFAAERGLSVRELEEKLSSARARLFRQRSERVRPQLDDKVILGWNALMNSACSRAMMATGEKRYGELAERNMQFLLESMAAKGGGMMHTWKEGKARHPAFLDDYAFLVEALIDLQEISGNRKWLQKAAELMEWVDLHFSDDETGLYFYTAEEQRDVIVRKKELYDSALPSGNSVMAGNAHRLGLLLDRPAWRERSTNVVLSFAEVACKYPVSFGVWTDLVQEMIFGTREIAVVGKHHAEIRLQILAKYVPHRVLMSDEKSDQKYPLLAEKNATANTLIFLCKDFVCQQPVETIERFMSLINSGKNAN